MPAVSTAPVAFPPEMPFLALTFRVVTCPAVWHWGQTIFLSPSAWTVFGLASLPVPPALIAARWSLIDAALPVLVPGAVPHGPHEVTESDQCMRTCSLA